MKTSQTPITPLEQAVVVIAGHEIIVVHLPGGKVGAAFRMFCDGLGLDDTGQVRRVRSHPVISDCLVLVNLETAKGTQEANVIIAEAIPIWLTGIHHTRVAPEAREFLRACQLDAARTIRGRFFPEVGDVPQSVPPKPEQPTPPLPPPDAALLAVAELFQVVGARITQEMQHMRAQLTTVEQEQRVLADQHIEAQRQLQALQAEVMALRAARKDSPPAADAALSDEHEEVLHVLLYCAELITNHPQEELEREMLAAAGVKQVGQIREANWFEMVVWLVRRLG